MAEGDRENSKRNEQEKRWEKEKQRWKEEDEKSERLFADIQALLKKVQDRRGRKDGDDDDDCAGVAVVRQ
jgi:hypothetical protein